MKIVADEGVDRQIVEALRRENHEVIYVAELAPGITDDEALRLANERDAVVLTADKDFGELVFRLNRAAAGVALIRLDGLPPDMKSVIVANAIREHGPQMFGAFSVIAAGVIRIRPASLNSCFTKGDPGH
jgi:predicted nuclease of predicted toxin-antitoxin system